MSTTMLSKMSKIDRPVLGTRSPCRVWPWTRKQGLSQRPTPAPCHPQEPDGAGDHDTDLGHQWGNRAHGQCRHKWYQSGHRDHGFIRGHWDSGAQNLGMTSWSSPLQKTSLGWFPSRLSWGRGRELWVPCPNLPNLIQRKWGTEFRHLEMWEYKYLFYNKRCNPSPKKIIVQDWCH